MNKIIINGDKTFQVEEKEGQLSVDGKNLAPDILELGEGRFHVLLNNKSYTVDVLEFDQSLKTGVLRVNGRKYAFEGKDRYDELLEKLGMKGMAGHKINQLKAPMPGLVLKINVKPGAEVKKGDSLLLLEAMKMENNIKSPGDGTVKTLSVKAGQTVEKNEVLMEFE